MGKKFLIRLNISEKVEDLLQETYDQVNGQIIQVQDEINLLSESTSLAEATMDEKAKYAKAMHDYIGDKEKLISRKLEIAKFMQEVIRYNGDLKKTLDDPNVAKSRDINLTAIRDMIQKEKELDDKKPEVYTLKNYNNGK